MATEVDGTRPFDADARAMRITTRVLWLALLGGQLIAAMRLIYRAVADDSTGLSSAPPAWISMAVALAAVALGYFLRNQTYKRAWRAQAVTPRGYLTGNGILLGLITVAAVFNLALMYVSGAMTPHIAVAIFCLVVHGVNFPHGKPMQTD
jgi:hypothetical protein